VATILTGVLVGLAAAVANIDEMVDLTNIGTLFAFILVCLGIMVLRFKDPGRERPFRVPSWSWLAALWPLLIFGTRTALIYIKAPGVRARSYFSPSWIPEFGWMNVILVALYAMIFVMIPLAVVYRRSLAEWLLPTTGLLSCVYLIFYLPPSSWWRFFGWLLAGLVVYFLYGFRHSRLRNGPGPRTFNPASDLPPDTQS
jgi:amino acid transporter